ncbi:MAG: hypothetical protein HUU32_12755 [Calditrichaceae bacterium]|nr:hypothetical protein [Calditrichia bacterium]NUQ42260.1 hypothetical protein [Calditrichaceae bacterium]
MTGKAQLTHKAQMTLQAPGRMPQSAQNAHSGINRILRGQSAKDAPCPCPISIPDFKDPIRKIPVYSAPPHMAEKYVAVLVSQGQALRVCTKKRLLGAKNAPAFPERRRRRLFFFVQNLAPLRAATKTGH